MLKRPIAVFAVAIVVIAAAGAWWATRVPASPFDRTSEASPSATAAFEATVARGAYVARQADCLACHTTENGASFAGGLAMGTPIGAIYTTNITPDRETGIGSYSLSEFDNAVRRGVARDGHRLYPAMPYPSYAKMTDEDVQSLYGYFMNRVTPVRQENRSSSIPWPLNMRWPLAFWNIPFYDGRPYVADPSRSAQWNRGAYLVQGAGHCGSCHTPRGLAMEERALDQGSDAYLSGALLDGWYAPSLRNDPNTGLGRWSESEIVSYLRTGRNVHGVVFGSMLEAFNNSTQHLSDEDLGAMAHYLKSLPSDPERDGKPWSYQAASARTGSPSNGEKIYVARCASCHGVDGRGQGRWISPLAGASSVLSPENASTINITLNGSGRVVQAGTPDSYRMPPLRQLLSDGEIADVLTYVRGAWGHGAPAVTPEDVAKLRRTTNPSSEKVIILQMR